VVVRRTGTNGHEVLLVHPANGSGDWVLPKGHIEPLETAAETGVREVREESGVWGRVRGELGRIEYSFRDEGVEVVFYLMEWLEDGQASEERSPTWMTFEDAIASVHRESALLLTLASQVVARQALAAQKTPTTRAG
jgi:ADP-ribose pyrophosphatase YjhB (NUDIX family)